MVADAAPAIGKTGRGRHQPARAFSAVCSAALFAQLAYMEKPQIRIMSSCWRVCAPLILAQVAPKKPSFGRP
eukprot:12589672-Alexandrium_andersonii.AAC.1